MGERIISVMAAGLIACSVFITACDSHKAEKEYLKTVRSDYDAVSSIDMPSLNVSGSQTDSAKQIAELDAAQKTCSDLNTKTIEAQARRKLLSAGLEDKETKSLDQDLDAYFADLQKTSKDGATFFATIKNILIPLDRLTRAIESLNEPAEDKEKLLNLFQSLKDALKDGARDLGNVSIPEAKADLQKFRDMTAEEFRKPLPIIDDMMTALRKSSAAKLETAGKKFEEWGSEFDSSYKKNADVAMQPEVDSIETSWNKISDRNNTIREKLSRLEGRL